MIKHSYIILPAPELGGRQTIVSITIHGDAPAAQAPSRTAMKDRGRRGGGRKASS